MRLPTGSWRRFICRIFGHNDTRSIEYSRIGKQYCLEDCERCGRREIKWKGPIFPGHADNPDLAVRLIEKYSPRDPPEPGEPGWGGDGN